MTISKTSDRALASVFDRRQARHPWQKAFRELMQADPMRRFVCSNWQMEPRVTQSRENDLLEAAEFAGEPDGDGWWQRRGEYSFRTLGRPLGAGLAAEASHLQPPGESNVISRLAIPAHEQLVHVASLNRLLARITSEHLTADLRLAFPDLTGRPLPERPIGDTDPDPARFGREVDEIAAAVNRRGDSVRELAGLLCDALGDDQPPWWANFAEEVMPLIHRGDWTGLCQALGLGHLEAGEWLILWRYEVAVLYLTDAAAPLSRPTVVEADDNPFYFPAPPGTASGITMPLSVDRRGACREVIHPPLRGRAAADSCADQLRQLASPPVADPRNLAALRQRHRRNLERQHPQPQAADWFRRHQDLP